MATVDIVLATYNGERYLGEQLDSLLAQTEKDIRIMICDDGSSDSTEEIVRSYMLNHDNIVWHRNKTNIGYTYNFLHGVKRTSAPYVMLCDQDDIWYPDKVEKTLSAMKNGEKDADDGKETPILVFTDAEIYNGRTSEKRGYQDFTHHNPKKVDLSGILMENKCTGCTVMVNRSLVERITHMPAGIRYHDWWMALIAAGLGRVIYLDEMTLKYRQHGDNQVGGAGFVSYVKNRLGSVHRQKEQLCATYRQGKAFYGVYMEALPEKNRRIAESFATMESAGPLGRRVRMLRYGFTKSGLLRNLGLFLLI